MVFAARLQPWAGVRDRTWRKEMSSWKKLPDCAGDIGDVKRNQINSICGAAQLENCASQIQKARALPGA